MPRPSITPLAPSLQQLKTTPSESLPSLERRMGRPRRQLRLASSLFEGSRDGIVILDAENCIVDLNPAYARLVGSTKSSLLGRRIRLLCSDTTATSILGEICSSLAEHDHWEGETCKRHADGHAITVWVVVSQIRDAMRRVTHRIAVFNDISRQRETQNRLQRLAFTDSLTGLPNRTCFAQHAERMLQANRYLDSQPVILMIDLDEFKQVNDSLGHAMGDLLLCQVAERMRCCLRKEDLLARFGGDEFVVLLEYSNRTETYELVAGKLLNALEPPFNLQGTELYIRASVGIYQADPAGDTLESLLQKADIAMYQAKNQGKGRYHYFDEALNRQVRRKAALTAELHKAIANQQLHLHYQLQVNSYNGAPVGMEALLRWQHPEFGAISPYEFIPLAEASGLIVPIGNWVLQTVCSQMALWRVRAGVQLPVAVNVSAEQFYDEQLAERITALLQAVRIPPSQLELEVTESAAMTSPEKAALQLSALRAIGVSIAIDDFGTGYSSLSYLKKLPVSKLKVDRSLVQDVVIDSDSRAITQAVIKLAHAMNLQVIAEGVESEAVRALLIQQGCDLIQGYLFSCPVPPDEVPALVKRLQGAQRITHPPQRQVEPRWCTWPCKRLGRRSLSV